MAQILSRLRQSGFWWKDALSGGRVRYAYRMLKKIDACDSDSEFLNMYRTQAVKRLLHHATQTTKYYGTCKGRTLNHFPVVDKNLLTRKKAEFLSSAYIGKKTYVKSTSGSTGTPFSCIQDKGKIEHLQAEVIHYSEKAGYTLGESQIYLRALNRETKKSGLKQFIQNQTLLDISRMDDAEVAEVLRRMHKSSAEEGAMVLAYASTLETFSDYFRRNGLDKAEGIRIQGMVSCAEMLFDDTRQRISESFQCRCYSRYSNQENGILGQDVDVSNIFLINEAHYLIEIFRMDKDELALPGETGRIVVTDLFNYAMPMIRYDTGDIGAIEEVEWHGVRKRALTNFGGRRIDQIYDSYGQRLEPAGVEMCFSGVDGLKQFQVIQETRCQYTVKVNTDESFVAEGILLDRLQELFGEYAEITLEKVDEIPVLASGKRKCIVSMMSGVLEDSDEGESVS